MKKFVLILSVAMLLSISTACSSSKKNTKGFEESMSELSKQDSQVELLATEKNTNVDTEKLTIPSIKLSESISPTMDMKGIIVYNGKIYTQAEYLECDQTTKKSFMEEYLGKASGTIDEWSSKNEYSKELASNVTGDVYSVKGYDKAFRICIPEMYDGCDFIAFFENLNGITLETGKDLFNDRLHLKENYVDVTYKSNDDWNNNSGDFKRLEGITNTDYDNFFDALYQAPFEDISNKIDIIDLKGLNTDFNQSHIFLKMEDGTTIELRLLENGYVGYQGMQGQVFAKMSDDNFSTIFQASLK